MSVDLVFDADCPNVDAARDQLKAAFAQLGIEPAWRELVNDDDMPEYARGYGSPTVLVDQRDVAGATPSDGSSCCRVYRDANGVLVGVPTIDDLVVALRAATEKGQPCVD